MGKTWEKLKKTTDLQLNFRKTHPLSIYLYIKIYFCFLTEFTTRLKCLLVRHTHEIAMILKMQASLPSQLKVKYMDRLVF